MNGVASVGVRKKDGAVYRGGGAIVAEPRTPEAALHPNIQAAAAGGARWGGTYACGCDGCGDRNVDQKLGIAPNDDDDEDEANGCGDGRG